MCLTAEGNDEGGCSGFADAVKGPVADNNRGLKTLNIGAAGFGETLDAAAARGFTSFFGGAPFSTTAGAGTAFFFGGMPRRVLEG